MSGVLVGNIDDLERLWQAAERFQHESLQQLRLIENSIRETEFCVEKTLRSREAELRSRENERAVAQQVLLRCENSGHYDRDGRYSAPNCTGQHIALQEAGRRVAEAERQLAEARTAQRMLNSAATRYRDSVPGFSSIAAQVIPGGVFNLKSRS